ncbi:MAG: cytochrome c maturation protein CcmE [Gammaproteobacteria bacterium]|nr:cytochrome c maturation protein CcmE [Gammaproteobacteria bacterium]|tara:strand:+ start:177251 stop:177709 length:459 start_codon:yes stop_codon:yes gene_type:complete
MKKRTIRIYYVLIISFLLVILFFLFIKIFNENLLFYRSPSEISQTEFPPGYVFRIGGVVVNNSLIISKKTTDIQFYITDFEKKILVKYSGILPDLFREGQGVVIRGKLLSDGSFLAEEVLAKHDETYMPPEVSESLKINKKQLEETSKSIVK